MNLYEAHRPWRSVGTWISSTLVASVVFWACFSTCVSGCIDAPLPEGEPQARVVTSWDPLQCGDPHRVVLELEDEDGHQLARSVPCEAGAITIDIAHWGIYQGRLYAWTLPTESQAEIRAETKVRLEVDAPVIFWTVDTPR
jgi:hypothetical protein